MLRGWRFIAKFAVIKNKKQKSHNNMSRKLVLKRGLDLDLVGAAQVAQAKSATVGRVAIVPGDYPGFTPKPSVSEGDEVVPGTALFHDKWAESVNIVSSVQGKVRAIVRGARRKIERIEVDVVPSEAAPVKVTAPKTADEAREFLQRQGLWAMMRQRPYDIVPVADAVPRDIFVSAFDSNPLAPNYDFLLEGHEAYLAEGVRILKLLTPGRVYVSRRLGRGMADIAGAEMVDVEGPHPSGIAGVQAANIAPVNKGETIFTLDALTLSRIGVVALTGHDGAWITSVAVTGSEVITPEYVDVPIGASLAAILAGNVKDDGRHHRIIGGNVFTGKRESIDGYLRYPYTQVTVIPEGDDADEFMGWASMSPSKSSVSRSFLGHFRHHKLNPDARLMGGRRAMIMSGEYDKVMPMDILPEYLIKAIIARDIDKMEALGIYEVAPEDFAVAEYVDTSKLPLQQIVRDGLDYLRKELS